MFLAERKMSLDELLSYSFLQKEVHPGLYTRAAAQL